MKKQNMMCLIKKLNYRILFFLSIFLLSPQSIFAVEPLALRLEEAAPEFRLSSLAGREISLSEYKNKSVVLFFWATWCPYCTAELPDLQKRHRDIKAAGINILAINIGEPEERVEKFFNKNKVEFPVLLDRKNEVAHSYGVRGIPTYVLIDAQGKIRFQSNSFPDNYLSILKR